MIQTLSGRQFPAFVIPLIDSAKNSIDIVVYDWHWYPSDPGSSCQLFSQAILNAARRHVKVRAVLNNNDTVGVLKSQNCEAKKWHQSKLMHAKLIIIDNQTVITGSHNYTQSAFNINFELSVVLYEENIVKDCNVFFNNIWNLV